MSFSKKLAALKDNYAKAKETKNAPFEINIENGKYRVALTNLELRESSTSGKLMVQREWTVLEGDHADTTFSDFIHIESDWGMVNLQRFIEQMGYEVPEKPEVIEDVLNAILGEKPECIIMVRIKDDFINVRVREVIQSGAAAADAGAGEAAAATPEAEPEPEVTPEAEPDATVEDDLAPLDRAGLKALLKEEEIAFTVYKNTEDDAIREAIRAARDEKAGAEAAVETESEPEAELEQEPEPEAEAPAAPAKKPVAKPAPAKAPAAAPVKGNAKLDALKNFCDANDVAYDRKKADEKTLIAAIKKGKYKAADLTDKEKKLLKEIGVVLK